jgi:hypothetical protein
MMLPGPDDAGPPFWGPDDVELELDPEACARDEEFHRERAARFQQTFVGYFPNLGDIKVAAAEWDWLYTGAVLNPAETLQRSKAKAGMRRVANALRILSTHDLRHPLILPDLDLGTNDPVVLWENEIIHIISALWEMEHQGLTLKVIDKLVADSDALVDATPETANVNWSAVNAVHALRWLWWRNTGKYAPARALNPASKFHAYLSDGLEFLGIQADPVSAFKAWVKRWPEVV